MRQGILPRLRLWRRPSLRWRCDARTHHRRRRRLCAIPARSWLRCRRCAKRAVARAQQKPRTCCGRRYWRRRLPHHYISHQVCSSDRDLRFVRRSIRTPENRAPAVLRVTIRVMRRPASRTILAFALSFANFCPAIGADGIQLRCLS